MIYIFVYIVINKNKNFDMETFIRNILSLGLSNEIIDQLLQKSMEEFIAAFTTKNYDSENNYEFFEQMGDLSINKFIVNYTSKRFPHLRNSGGVAILASLRIIYGSKEELSKLSEKYGMDKFIRCTNEEAVDKNRFKDILEDVFEAFFGVLEFAVNDLYSFNENTDAIGYGAVCAVLKRMFDDLDIRIDYKSLVNAKTRLNELKDEAKLNVVYKDKQMPNGIFHTDLFVNGKLAGTGEDATKKMSQIIASENALQWIEENLNITKEVPERYKTISKKIWGVNK